MKSKFRWHHVGAPDYELPESGKNLIVRCADGDFLKTKDGCNLRIKFGLVRYDSEKEEFYDYDFFYSDKKVFEYVLTNVAAWCYIKDVYEQLNNTGWGFDPDKEANDDNNTRKN